MNHAETIAKLVEAEGKLHACQVELGCANFQLREETERNLFLEQRIAELKLRLNG